MNEILDIPILAILAGVFAMLAIIGWLGLLLIAGTLAGELRRSALWGSLGEPESLRGAASGVRAPGAEVAEGQPGAIDDPAAAPGPNRAEIHSTEPPIRRH